MKKFAALFTVNLKAVLLTSSSKGRSTRRKVTGGGLLALLAFLALSLSCSYSLSFAMQLSTVGMTRLVLSLMAVLATAMGVLFTVFAVQGVVFGGRDNDLMLSLPVSAFQLMLARVLALALENLVFSVFVMLPACGAYAFIEGAFTAGFLLRGLLATAFLALLPTTLALVLGFLLSWLSAKFTRGQTLVRNLLYFLFLAAIMAGSFRLGFLMQDLASYAAGIQAGFSAWGAPFLLYQDGVCGSWPCLLGFAALCVLPFLLAVWLFGRRYKALVTSLSARSARSDYKLERQSAAGAVRALLGKEARRFFGTTMYLFNAGFGFIMLLILSAALLVKGGELTAMLAALDMPVLPLLALAMLFCLSTGAVSASSISLEGKYLWILKEAPIHPRQVLRIKWGFQLLLALPCVAVGAVCGAVGCALPLAELGALVLVCAGFALFHAPLGLYLNLCFPKLDAANETAVVKQSMASFLGGFLPMLALIPGAALWWLLRGPLGDAGALALCGVLELLAALGLILAVDTKGVRLLEALS